MDFRLLGSLEVEREGRFVPLGSPKERALLALLLLHANDVVSRDTLIDGLWKAPPPTSVHTLESHVSRLRKLLEADEARILTRPGGYVIDVDPERVDLFRFERLRDEAGRSAAAGDAASAAERLRAALSLWHGPPLADLTEPFADVETTRLAELRSSALEELFDVELALGRHHALLADLEALAAERPERERLTGQLMLALYRAGRQAEALAAYETARRHLNDELGIEPGKELKALQHAILRQDPGLDLSPPAAPTAGAGGAEPPAVDAATIEVAARPTRRRSRRGVWAAILMFLAATATIAGLATRLGDGGRPVALAGNGIGILDPGSGRVVRAIALGFVPGGVAIDGTDVWAIGPSEGTLVRIRAGTGVVVQTVNAGDLVGAFAIGAGAAWVTRPPDATLARIDLETGRVVESIPVGKGAAGVAFGYGSVWVALPQRRTVVRLDPRTGRAEATIETGIAGSALTVGEGGVWVAAELEGIVVEIDPGRNEPIRAVNLGAGPSAVAAGAGALWVANNDAGTVSRVDPRTGTIRSTVAVDAAPAAIAVAPGTVWVAGEGAAVLTRLNPWDGSVVRTVSLPGRPAAVAQAGGVLAVALAAPAAPHRGGTLRVRLLSGSIDTIDPARAVSAAAWSVLSTVGDGLVGFRRRTGPDGRWLAADLAERLPPSIDGMTTYTFQLRRGIRFSDGTPVRPADIRFTIERLFRAGSPGGVLYTGIVGGALCARDPENCDLSKGIVVDGRRRTVSFRLAAPDRDFLYKLALPFAYVVPSGSPPPRTSPAGTARPERPLPGTGPYMVASYVPGRTLTLVRNPWFRASGSASRPDGCPDGIAISIVPDTRTDLDAMVAAVEDGRIDLAVVPAHAPAASRFRRLRPGRAHPWSVPSPDAVDVRRVFHASGELVALSERVGDYQQSPVFGPLLDQLWVR